MHRKEAGVFGLVVMLCVAALAIFADCNKPPVVPSQDADAQDVVVVFAADASFDGTPVPPAIDAAPLPPTLSEQACAALAKAGCPEAAGKDGGDSCVASFDHAEASGHFTLKPACIAACSTATCVRACGTVRCIGVK